MIKRKFGYVRIMTMLLWRDLYVMKSTLLGAIIDSGVALGTEFILAVYLLPLMGMPRFLIAPLFVGGVYARLFSLANNGTLRLLFSMRKGGLPFYEAIFPLPKYWLFTRNVIRFTIETLLILGPVIGFSIILLGKDIGLGPINYIYTLFFLITSSLFFGGLSLFLAHHYTLQWYLENGWARRLSIFFMTSVLFITWKTCMRYAPWFAYITLLNPTTYMVEGMRAALLGGENYLPMAYSVGGTLFFCTVMLLAMGRSITKRLDLI
jgi:hypothetical protein